MSLIAMGRTTEISTKSLNLRMLTSNQEPRAKRSYKHRFLVSAYLHPLLTCDSSLCRKPPRNSCNERKMGWTPKFQEYVSHVGHFGKSLVATHQHDKYVYIWIASNDPPAQSICSVIWGRWRNKSIIHIMFETAGPHILYPRIAGGAFTCGL